MPDAREYEQNLAGDLVEKKTGVSPASLSHYWEMTPPKKLGLSEGGGAGADLKRFGGFGPAPRLSPAGMSEKQDNKINSNSTGPSKHINIRDEHHWTESPISARREVPVLNLKELRIMMNPMLNQLANNVFAFAEAAGTGIDTLESVYNELTDQGFDFGTGAKKLQGSEEDENTDKKKKQKAEEDQKSGIRTASNYLSNGVPEATVTDFADPMNPYSLLYTTKPTQFKYSIPYMDDRYIENTGNFGGSMSAGNLVEGLSDAAAGATKLLQTINLRKMFAPGRMIEEPKAFTFTGREQSYTCTFPLFNTKSYQEIVKNWQFIYLLSYQNTPNRVNRDLIDPPCIYEAYIPGVWYSKFAAITNMSVQFIGARREMFVPVKFIDKAGNQSQEQASWESLASERKVLTVIPDAYEVTITLTELFAETQNMKHQMLSESMNTKISTGVINE